MPYEQQGPGRKPKPVETFDLSNPHEFAQTTQHLRNEQAQRAAEAILEMYKLRKDPTIQRYIQLEEIIQTLERYTSRGGFNFIIAFFKLYKGISQTSTIEDLKSEQLDLVADLTDRFGMDWPEVVNNARAGGYKR